MHILDLLKADKFVSGQEIARTLGISRAAVHKQVQKLRKTGYGISGARNSGYMLLLRPDLVTPEELKQHFKKFGVPEQDVFYFTETSSTQDEAKKVAEKNPRFPSLVIAEKQTGSYGRRRRPWLSPQGGLWFSLLLKPDIPPEKIPQITFTACLAVCRAVEVMLGLNPLIKWPNDVTCEGKKFAGILTEMSAEVGKLNWVVVGIGINVNNRVPDGLKDRAVALSALKAEKINRAELLAAVLDEFYGLYNVFVSKGFAGFRKEYNAKSLLTGSEVNVDTGDGILRGKALKVDSEGYLWIKTAAGKTEKIIAGDVVKADN